MRPKADLKIAIPLRPYFGSLNRGQFKSRLLQARRCLFRHVIDNRLQVAFRLLEDF